MDRLEPVRVEGEADHFFRVYNVVRELLLSCVFLGRDVCVGLWH